MRRAAHLLAAALAVGCVACNPGATAEARHSGGTAHPLDSSSAAEHEPGALRLVRADTVRGWTGPDGSAFEVARRTPVAGEHARGFGSRTLPIALRTAAPELTQYPCTACHLGRRIELSDERSADAHANVRVTHPRATGGTCATCHSAADVELLALRSGERVGLDQAYRVCAQCHYGQADAWAAGAHGKRLDGWQGRRVVMGCTDCHDPHAPALATRLPFRAPRLHRPGSSRHER
jgi:hypothetical protein